VPVFLTPPRPSVASCLLLARRSLSVNSYGSNRVQMSGVSAATAMLGISAAGLNASLMLGEINVATKSADVFLEGTTVASKLIVRVGGGGLLVGNNVVQLGSADMRTESGDAFVYFFAAAGGSSCMPACYAQKPEQWAERWGSETLARQNGGCNYVACSEGGFLGRPDDRNCFWKELKPKIPFCLSDSAR